MEYTEIFEVEVLSQEEIESAENTHSALASQMASQMKRDSRPDK